MRFRKMGSEDVGESTSRRHVDPESGQEEINITDQDLAATPPLEDEPEFRDILPDQIREFTFGDSDEDEERELTVQSHERIHPIRPDELPEG